MVIHNIYTQERITGYSNPDIRREIDGLKSFKNHNLDNKYMSYPLNAGYKRIRW